jgi:NADH-quinone oxidoreductase subunit G
VVASERPTALDGGAETVARYEPGTGGAFLARLHAALDSVEENDASAIAEALRGAEKVVIIWGERVNRGGATGGWALAEIGSAIGMAERDGAGLLEIPDATNARGLREVGCLPDAGPGLAETERGIGTEQIRSALESGEITTLLLFGVDPLRDFPDAKAWDRALTAVDHLIAFSTFDSATTARADVVFPLETHAEKDGTVTHPDGRLQRVRPNASRPGDIRPNWGVLAELSLALGDDTGIDSQPSAFEALTTAVPFYAGITDAELGGRGARWQERQQASALPQAADGDLGAPSEGFAQRAASEEGVPAAALRLGTYRDLWAGPITELNPPLRFLRPEQRLEVSPQDAERLGLRSGAEVRVGQNGSSVAAKVVVRERVQQGVCFLIEGVADGNANALLNGRPARVEISKLEPALP